MPWVGGLKTDLYMCSGLLHVHSELHEHSASDMSCFCCCSCTSFSRKRGPLNQYAMDMALGAVELSANGRPYGAGGGKMEVGS